MGVYRFPTLALSKRLALKPGKQEWDQFMMHSIYRAAALLIPGGLAVTFMLWVLWNFHKFSRRR